MKLDISRNELPPRETTSPNTQSAEQGGASQETGGRGIGARFAQRFPASANETKSGGFFSFVAEEADGIIALFGGLAIAVVNLFGIFKELSAPIFVILLVAIAVRVFRVKYHLDGSFRALSLAVQSIGSEIGESQQTLASEIHDVGTKLTSSFANLRDAIHSDRLHEGEVCDRPRFYEHMLAALRSARHTVDLTQLDANPPSHYGTPAMEEYFRAQTTTVKERRDVIFRRVVAIPTLEKLLWLLDVIDAARDCNNFQIRIIDTSSAGSLPPPLSLQIFDAKELCLVDPTVGYMRPEQQLNMLWLRGSAACRVFSIYYEELWKLSKRIKEGSIVFWDELERCRDGLERQFPSKAGLARQLKDRIEMAVGKPTGEIEQIAESRGIALEK